MPANRLRKRLVTRLLRAVAVGVLAPGTAMGSAAAPCAGTVQLTGTSNLEVRQAGSQTFLEFDFTGLHDICLADGSLVTGTIAGHLAQHTAADRDLSIRFDEVLTYGGGAPGFRGEASLANGRWQSHVQTVGTGTGPVAGIHGQGGFWLTGPTSLADLICYVYAP